MNSFNLLYEPWIVVMIDERGSTKEVSLLDLFENAHIYKKLAGETPVQDFAILRFLLSVMYTVFTRFDCDGKVYKNIELDDRFIPTNYDVKDSEEYLKSLYRTWGKLWEADAFPEIIKTYLMKWSDRFNLFDEKYPFYQVTDENLNSKNISKKGEINYKLINRLISESNNKTELFSPVSESYKNNMGYSELTRWLITFQGYTGTGDKAKFPNMKESASKGWLLGLGSIYLKGDNIRSTILLNMIMSADNNETIKTQFLKKQTPIWEKTLEEKIDDLMNKIPNNLSELYTNWSRLIQIKSGGANIGSLFAVQLPKIDDSDFFLEPMTIWKQDKKTGIKTPNAHNTEKYFWRSFENISLNDANHTIPTIIEWQNIITKDFVEEKLITVVSVGLNYNRDASTMPNDQIYDELSIYNNVLADIDENLDFKDEIRKLSWVGRISNEIEKTQKVITFSIRNFANDIVKIRNLSDKSNFANEIVKKVYYDIDLPFRQWLSTIRIKDDKDEKMNEWKEILRKIILSNADEVLEKASRKDYLGKKVKIGKGDETKFMNIVIAYNIFRYNLKRNID